jgi:hypothetical protein
MVFSWYHAFSPWYTVHNIMIITFIMVKGTEKVVLSKY